jgi:hypothetical protein
MLLRSDGTGSGVECPVSLAFKTPLRGTSIVLTEQQVPPAVFREPQVRPLDLRAQETAVDDQYHK